MIKNYKFFLVNFWGRVRLEDSGKLEIKNKINVTFEEKLEVI